MEILHLILTDLGAFCSAFLLSILVCNFILALCGKAGKCDCKKNEKKERDYDNYG